MKNTVITLTYHNVLRLHIPHGLSPLHLHIEGSPPLVRHSHATREEAGRAALGLYHAVHSHPLLQVGR